MGTFKLSGFHGTPTLRANSIAAHPAQINTFTMGPAATVMKVGPQRCGGCAIANPPSGVIMMSSALPPTHLVAKQCPNSCSSTTRKRIDMLSTRSCQVKPRPRPKSKTSSTHSRSEAWTLTRMPKISNSGTEPFSTHISGFPLVSPRSR